MNALEPKYHSAEIVSKGWGHEEIICNNEHYCGKILHLKKGARFSMHAHRNKHETFLVQNGRLTLRFIRVETGLPCQMRLETGHIVEIPRMCPHQLIALEASEIVEFSTHHEDGDSYRYEPGDSQQPKPDKPSTPCGR